MRRREFITLLGGAATWPLAAKAQSSTTPVIGVLYSGRPTGYWLRPDAALRRGLNDAGYAEGRNLRIEARWAEDHYDRLPDMAADLVQQKVAVIAAVTTTSARAVKAATDKIPVVFVTIADPVQIGFVGSLSRPGGNMTGVTVLSVEVGSKRLELLHETVPSATTIALLLNPKNPNATTEAKKTQAAAHRLGLTLPVLYASTEIEFDATFAKLRELRANALTIGQDGFFNNQMSRLAALSVANAIPAIYSNRDFTVAGGLISYGANELDLYRQAGVYVGRILKGDKPADLPVVQASKFEMCINLKTAKKLGLTISADVLSIADEVIE